jgi:hypothetical protein
MGLCSLSRWNCGSTHLHMNLMISSATARGLLQAYRPAASKHSTLNISRDQAHRVERHSANSALRADSEHGMASLRSARRQRLTVS